MKSCRNGHPRTTANGYFKANGYWTCRICARARTAKRNEQYKSAYFDAGLRPGKASEVVR